MGKSFTEKSFDEIVLMDEQQLMKLDKEVLVKTLRTVIQDLRDANARIQDLQDQQSY